MKKLMIVLAATALIMSSCGGSSTPRSEKDSLAYALGMDYGTWLKNTMDSTLNINVVAAGIRDAIANNTKMDRDSAANFINEWFYVRKPAQAKAESEKFLLDIEKSNPNAIKTASGLLYEIVTPGDTATKATAEDKVRVIYEGKLRSGKVFDSSIERGDTAEFLLNQVIPGWTEGVQLVGKGGKIKLWIPSNLAYGERGGGAIGANEALAFEVELVDVIPAEQQDVK